MPHFSIITINLNNAIGLEKTICSVLSQSSPDYEYLIIDGGSTDGSVEIIKKYAEKITYWVSERDAGVYDAMNKGIAAACGQYCLFLNSGDYFYEPTVLSQVLHSGLKADIIYGDLIQSTDGQNMRRLNNPDRLSAWFLLPANITHQTQFIRRQLFEDHGAYRTEYAICSDYAFLVHLFFKTNCQYSRLPAPLVVFDTSGISNNPANEKRVYQERMKIQKLYFPPQMALLYSVFVFIWRSGFFVNPVMALPVKYFRLWMMKILGEEQISFDKSLFGVFGRRQK